MNLILGRRSNPLQRAIGFSLRAQAAPSGELLTYSGDGHLITFAPTGTGKTSGPVICNALTHPGELIVLDIKGEVYAATADARRAMRQEVHVLDLREHALGGSLNPLDLAMGGAPTPPASGVTGCRSHVRWRPTWSRERARSLTASGPIGARRCWLGVSRG
jgi:hypothetical protein